MKKRVLDAAGAIAEVDASDPRPALVELETTTRKSAALELDFQASVTVDEPANDAPKSYRFSVLEERWVKRVDPDTGEVYWLWIVCSPEAGNLDRARGGSLRDLHDGPQVGSTQSADFVERRLYVGGARFLSGDRAREIEQGIQPQPDGSPPILQNVSPRVIPIAWSQLPASEDGMKRMVCEQWEYMHTAFVPDPAIATVGIDRAHDDHQFYEVPVRVLELTREEETAVKKKVRDGNSIIEVDASDSRPALTEVELAAAAVTTPPVVTGPARSVEYSAEDRREIQAMAEQAGFLDNAENRTTLNGWMEQSYSVDRIGRELLKIEFTEAVKQPGSERTVELSAKEANNYRYSRAIAMQAGILPKEGLEFQVHQELKRQFPGANAKGGLLVPTRLRPESFTAPSAEIKVGKGAELVQSGPLEFMDLMRVAPVCRRMGARFIPTSAGSIPFVRRTAGAIAYFTATGSKPTKQNAGFQILEATPHRAVAVMDYSRELLLTASRAIDTMFLQDVVNAHAPAWDWAALYGPGGKDPLGIMKIKTGALGSAGVKIVDFDDHVPTSALLRSCVRNAAAVEALTGGALGYVMNGFLADVLAETPRVSGTNDYILKPAPGGGPDEYRFGNYPVMASNQVGTTGSDYDGLFGPFDNIVFVGFGAMEVITNPFEKDEEGIIKVTAAQYVDSVCIFPEAFTKFHGARLANA
jgi:HK97 family phage major capsid protein